ncbi:hypothetical protein BJ912DRAFT_975754 [Pholiota molesta]|nr:hypothetical protein BJ912DRAFT_975754 [Pholiota molesta]
MLGTPVSYQELSDYLRGATSSLEDDIPRLISSLQYPQDRIDDLARIAESLNNAGPPKGILLRPKSWVTLSRKKKQAAKLRKSEGDSYAVITALYILLSPIRRLPPELLTEIFIYSLPQQQFILPGDVGSPLRLMQVCTEWWKVSVSTRAINNGTTIGRHEDASTFRISYINVWLSRSGDLPLSLSIQDDLLSIEDVRHILGAYAGRIQHLKVKVPEKTSDSLPDHDYPRLESFEIHTPKGLQITSSTTLSQTMSRAPKLRRFIWESVTSGVFRPPPIELRWSDITHLILHATISLEHCFKILSALQRSKFPLQILNLSFMPLQELDLIECLQYIQGTLTELTVQTKSPLAVTDVLLDKLTYTGLGDVLCPRLEILAFYDCLSCSPGRLARMARSRLRFGLLSARKWLMGQLGVSPLRVIELYASNPELPTLKPLRNLGLQLVAYSDTDLVTIDIDQP